MFAARGLAVSLAFFAVVYSLVSLLVVLVWQGMKCMRQGPPLNSASFLFGLRLFPFAVSVGVSVFFTFPSFWLLERASPDEDIETFVLALCSLLMLGAGLFRVLRAQARTTRAVTQWQLGACSNNSGAITPATTVSSGAPPLVLVGIRRPVVMVSDVAAALLSEDELRVAIRHELEHMRSKDNLKKAFVNATPFPGMSDLENTWREAAELAADDAAVTDRQEALDLAAALIKLSRFCQRLPRPLLATGLVGGPSSIRVRVERLLAWHVASRRFQRMSPWTFLVLFTMVLGIASNYGATLALTHRLTELLVP